MNNPYAFNTHLIPLIQNFIEYFGKTRKPVVWEVGSRDGHDAVYIAKEIYSDTPEWFWSYAEITALEANPEQAKIVRKNYPEMTVIEVAASNNRGSAPFMVYEGDEGAVGSSSLNLDWKDDLPGHQIVVETDTLHHLMGDEKIDIMKIDVEGHSMEVLEGIGDKLKNVKCYHIETEKWTDSNVKVKAFMMSHGYMLVNEDEQYGGMPDQVWVRH